MPHYNGFLLKLKLSFKQIKYYVIGNLKEQNVILPTYLTPRICPREIIQQKQIIMVLTKATVGLLNYYTSSTILFTFSFNSHKNPMR